ncbi:K(+)-INSENSITIVE PYROPHOSPHATE-ENERGIZED PROTON PUMP [Salix purpurea]|uniref:H(+)-exporting diphosphatase n=1 Tax=Salix purpurea TaxID=77065 RepID=A0A9Q0TAC6_SALPP|nr:K(+)-INSENSITIVE PYROPHOSPHATE-ENERGIZED PROTON PUMP [Salix purpurea]
MPHPSLFTEYQSVGVSMVAFAPLIFLFPGSVEGFSMRNRRCLKIATFDNASCNGFSSCCKWFAGGIAEMTGMSLFGSSVISRAGISADDVLNPKVFIGPIVGAMLPSSLVLFHGHIEECGRCTRFEDGGSQAAQHHSCPQGRSSQA